MPTSCSSVQNANSRRDSTLPSGSVFRRIPCGKTGTRETKSAIVAYTLLPLFRNEPTGWNAVGRVPSASAMFHDYLREWSTLVEEVDKPFLKCLLEAFELNP